MNAQNSSLNKTRIGFVGAGGIAPEHADTLGMLKGVEVVAVCDFDQFRAKSLAEQYRIPHVYSSLAEMLATERLDVVHVLTQPQHHVPVAMECLRAGVNVYVEKPMALSTADCTLLADEAGAHGCVVGVNHQFAHYAPIEEIVQAAKDRRFGRINHVMVSYCVAAESLPVREMNHYMFSTPSALLFEYCPHPFSILRRLVGRPLGVTALASDRTVLENGREFYKSWSVAAEAERGTGQLFFSAGRGNAQFTVEVYGQDASARADIWRGTLLFHENSPFPITAHLRDGWTNAKRLFTQASQRMAEDRMVKLKMKPPSIVNRFYPTMSAFYAALQSGKPLGENATAGRDVIAYCEMAAASMKTVG